MPGYTVIADVGNELVNILREYMVPEVISHEESIGLCSPEDKGNFNLGIYLYDIRESDEVFENGMREGGRHWQKYPSTYLSLYYMITAYSQSNVKFRSMQEHRIIGKAIQVLKDYGYLLSDTFKDSKGPGSCTLKMERMDNDEKMKLWSMSNIPYRLSVFYKVFPIEIESTRTKNISRVTSVDLHFKEKEIKGRRIFKK